MTRKSRYSVKCAYPACKFQGLTEKSKSIFRFPTNQKLLEKWLEKIPFLNLQKINKVAVLCGNHFEDDCFLIQNDVKKLKNSSVPKIFDQPTSSDLGNTCRFCMKKFGQEDQKVSLTRDIKKQYYSLTNTQLRDSVVYPETICRFCEADLLKFYVFKYFLLKNQEILHGAFAGLDDHRETENHFLNVDIEDQMDTKTKIKLETIEDSNQQSEEKHETNIDFQEEFLQINIKTDPDESQIFDENECDSDFEEPLKNSKRKVGAKKTSQESSANDYKRKRKDRVNSTVFCDLCGREFSGCTSNLRSLSFHLRHHLVTRDAELKGEFKCTYQKCNEIFGTRKLLQKHIRRLHYRKNEIHCHLCGEVFHIKERFDVHLRKHSGERPFVCDFPDCGKTFLSMGQRNHHKQIHGQSVTCEICGKIYANARVLQKHAKRHKEFAFKCEFPGCGKQFVEKSVFREHLKMHTGQKDFVCKYPGCLKDFFQKRSLLRHISSVHLQIKIPCEVPGCTSQLTSKVTYRAHVLGNHQNLEKGYLDHVLYNIRVMKVPKPDLNDVCLE